MMKSANAEHEKKIAAIQSVSLVKNGMVVGLGSGSTAVHMIRKLGEEVGKGLSIKGVPSSEKTAQLAKDLGIALISLEKAGKLDINIDGADEFDPQFRLIKGGGGALLWEKILAHNAKLNVIIADSGKKVNALGKFKLPLETIPLATPTIRAQLIEMGLKPVIRKRDGKTFRTDENNCILDVDIFGVKDIDRLNRTLIEMPGVVETGLFLKTTDLIIMGQGDETLFLRNDREREPSSK
ncbi:ribose-5-phosphate isomerase RpiA [Ulvibacterium sp.]|uniref:ribose-5-phosphate isomerase RpiA n=1 Tax=Ulvibacterium sp. TaxID=2665914 RepID=UPI003BAC0573